MILRDIPYLPESKSGKHTLDVYSPENTNLPTNTNVTPDKKKLPIIIIFHGGGWQRGSKDNEWRGAPSIARSLVSSQHFIVINANYRLAPTSIPLLIMRCSLVSIILMIIAKLIFSDSTVLTDNFFTIQFGIIVTLFLLFQCRVYYQANKKMTVATQPHHMLHDIAAVLHFVKKNKWFKQQFPLADTKNIFLAGHSAGAHLVSLFSLIDHEALLYPLSFNLNNDNNDNTESDNDDDNNNTKKQKNNLLKNVRGIISISGIYNVEAPFSSSIKNFFFKYFYASGVFNPFKKNIFNYFSPIKYVNNYYKHNNNFADDKSHLISNTNNNLNNNKIPFLIFSAESDLGLEHDAKIFTDSLRKVNWPFEYFVVPGTSHASISNKMEVHQARLPLKKHAIHKNALPADLKGEPKESQSLTSAPESETSVSSSEDSHLTLSPKEIISNFVLNNVKV